MGQPRHVTCYHKKRILVKLQSQATLNSSLSKEAIGIDLLTNKSLIQAIEKFLTRLMFLRESKKTYIASIR